MKQRAQGSPMLAAGGLLERSTSGALQIAVVHRTRYVDRDGGDGDWSLPKGKPDTGESIEETALREVVEETGCEARIIGAGFRTEYLVNGVPKIVTFFRMEWLGSGSTIDASEIGEVVWLTPSEAIERLTYDTERAVIEQAYPEVARRART